MGKNKRIVFVNQYYSPIKNPPAKRISSFANHLAKNGWKVDVITGMPNYPNGKLWKGYKWKLYKKEKEQKNITIRRFFEIPLKLEGFWKPFINYTSFAISSSFGFNTIRKADLVYISNPPTLSAITSFFIAQLFKKKIIFEVRDLYPETAEDLGLIKKNSLSYKLFKKINKHIFSKSQLVITIGSKLAEKIKRDYNIQHVEVITNFALKKEKSEIPKNNKIEIVFTGVITDAQELERVINLNKNKKIRDKFTFQIIGEGNRLYKIEELLKKYKYDNVKLHGYKSKEYCDDVLKKSDIGLITLANKQIFESALPSKFFEYTSFEKPVLANQSEQLKELIAEHDCGWFLKKGKEEEILLNITKEDIKNKSKNAIKAFNNNFEKEIICKQMESFCKKVIKK